MKSQIVYIKGHAKSEEQANDALKSFQRYNWDVELHEGYTPKTIPDIPSIVENSRLHNFKEENYNKYLTKVSCALNHLQFWKKVIEYNQPMAFLEHDAIAVDSLQNVNFKDYLILNAEYVFRPPNKLGIQKYQSFSFQGFGVNKLDNTYPLTYYRDNVWKGSFMVPGTGAYVISPSGAKKMLAAVEKYGLDQSDFMLNSFNLDIEYILPSPVKFNKVNLSTSYGI